MSKPARIVALAIGTVLIMFGIFPGIFADMLGHVEPKVFPIVFSLLVIGTVLLEKRYLRSHKTSAMPDEWTRTREKFFDDETGELLEVWIDPLTGERRYEPVAESRRSALGEHRRDQ